MLTYIDKGLGASILKAGLRLWDPDTLSPVAAIKVVRHNLLRPTSVLHEAGHQVAHMLDWNRQLAATLDRAVTAAAARRDTPSAQAGELGNTWASWASEIAADAFAFAHAGFGSAAALADVVSGGGRSVFRFHQGDPHPISFLRVLLKNAMCRVTFGQGPWDELDAHWRRDYPLSLLPQDPPTRRVILGSLPLIQEIATAVLDTPLPAFAGRSLRDTVDPRRNAPAALRALQSTHGPKLWTSHALLHDHSLRLLAISTLDTATDPGRADSIAQRQWNFMLRLGAPHA